MVNTFREMYKLKGWHVYMPPLVFFLILMVGVDNFLPLYVQNSEKIESIEIRLDRASALVRQKSILKDRIDTATAALKAAESKHYVSPTLVESRAAFLSTVTSIVAEMNLPKTSITQLPATDDASDVVSMLIDVSFDASPTQAARLEERLVEQSKTVYFDAMALAVAGDASAVPGAGTLNVSYRLRSVHINSNLF